MPHRSGHETGLLIVGFTADPPAELIVASIINARDVAAVGTIAAMGYDVDSGNYEARIRAERQKELDSILKKIARPSEKAYRSFLAVHKFC